MHTSSRLLALEVRPHARVQRREHRHEDVVGEAHPLAARHRHELRLGHALRRHHAHGLVGADDGGTGLLRDALRAPQVVEVRVADEDPVGAVDVVGRDARAGGARHAVDVGVEEHDELADGQPERRAAVPVERG